MSTPEGKVKDMTKKFLKDAGLIALGSDTGDGCVGFFWMPVPFGYGSSYLDFIGHYKGFFFGIETKAPKKNPTKMQQQAINTTTNTGAQAFVVREHADLEEIDKWFRRINKVVANLRRLNEQNS